MHGQLEVADVSLPCDHLFQGCANALAVTLPLSSNHTLNRLLPCTDQYPPVP